MILLALKFFPDVRKPFPFNLTMAYNSLINYTFVNRIETFIFTLYLIPLESGNIGYRLTIMSHLRMCIESDMTRQL